MSVVGKKPRSRVFRIALPSVLLAAALLLGLTTRRLEEQLDSPYPITRPPPYDAKLAELPVWAARSNSALAGMDLPVEFSFQRGETLGAVLADLGLQPAESQRVVSELAQHLDVRRLRPEDRYAALVDDDGHFQGVRLTLSGKGRAEVRREGGDWSSSWSEFEESSEVRVVKGVLEGSLEASIVNAGGEAVLAYVMSDVLQWDLDFNRDLRLGDRFVVLYELIYLDGEFHRVGGILALEYGNQDRQLEAYRFGDDGGHYDGEGRPLRKLFLKSPLRYSRVTSGFSNRRFHPILKRYQPHYGIDYSAPVGTPVRVTGGGVIQSTGREKGGGKTIRVRHPNGYLTAYLHLSRFADGVRKGTRVSQGEIIGYVGSTGLSTAPHLDYRMQKNGRWFNPHSLKSEPAEPIPPDQLARFNAVRDRFAEALASGEPRWEELAVEQEQIALLESP